MVKTTKLRKGERQQSIDDFIFSLLENYISESELEGKLNSLGFESLEEALEDQNANYEIVTLGSQRKKHAVTLEPKYVPGRNKIEIAYMDHVMFDSIVFDETAYLNAIKYIRDVGASLVITNPITRMDRPEWKRDELVYFNFTLEDIKKLLGSDKPPYDALISRLDLELKIFDTMLGKTRKILGDETPIYVLPEPDFGFSVNRLAHYLALFEKEKVETQIYELKEKKNKLRDKTKLELKQKKLEKIEKEIKSIESRIELSKEDIKKFSRPRKEAGLHQAIVNTAFRELHDKYNTICSKHNAVMVLSDEKIEINGNYISLNAHMTTAPKGQAAIKNFEAMMHNSAKDNLNKGIKLVIQGNSGQFHFSRFDTPPSPYVINGGHNRRLFLESGEYPSSVYGGIAPVFFDMEKVAQINSGKYMNRFAGRGASETRSHYVSKIVNNGGIAGLAIYFFTDGDAGVELIDYRDLKEKRIKLPKEYDEIQLDADAHIYSSSATRPEILLGARAKRMKEVVKPKEFRGKKVIVKGRLNAGDAGESNSSGFPGAGGIEKKPSVEEIYSSSIRSIKQGKLNLDQRLMKFANVFSNQYASPMENTEQIFDEIAKYYLPEIIQLAQKSDLKTIFAAAGGNHTYSAAKRLAISEYISLKNTLKVHDIKGSPKRYKDLAVDLLMPIKNDINSLLERCQFDKRYTMSNAFVIPSYGTALDGSILFGPVDVYLHHDPKPMRGMPLDKTAGMYGSNAGCQVSIIGHFHEFSAGVYNPSGEGDYTVAITLPTSELMSWPELIKPGKQRHLGYSSWIIPKKENPARHFIVVDHDPRSIVYSFKRELRLTIKRQDYEDKVPLIRKAA